MSRPALYLDTATTVQVNFRSWRDSGITWLALSGVPVDRSMRRAGHDAVQTTMGYVKQAEDMTGGELGEPFAPLPSKLLDPSGAVEASRDDLSSCGDTVAVRGEVVRALDGIDATGSALPSAAARIAVDEDRTGLLRDHNAEVAATGTDGTLASADAHVGHLSGHPVASSSPSSRHRSKQSAERAGFEPAVRF